MADQWTSLGLDLHLHLDSDNGLRAGLEQALREAIRLGRLVPGARLPSSRALAQKLGIARGTVTQAYEQLSAEGYLTTVPRSGVVVAPHPAPRPSLSLSPASSFRRPAAGFDLRPGLPDL